MDLHLLSKSYTVRKLDEADVDAIFELMRKNEIFTNTIHRSSQKKVSWRI